MLLMLFVSWWTRMRSPCFESTCWWLSFNGSLSRDQRIFSKRWISTWTIDVFLKSASALMCRWLERFLAKAIDVVVCTAIISEFTPNRMNSNSLKISRWLLWEDENDFQEWRRFFKSLEFHKCIINACKVQYCRGN